MRGESSLAVWEEREGGVAWCDGLLPCQANGAISSPRTPWTAEMRHRRLKQTDTDRRVEMEPHGSGTSRLEGHSSVCGFSEMSHL